jgi:putative ribosome biogenesis GTPase RsgA
LSRRNIYLPEKPGWKQVAKATHAQIQKNDIVITDNPIATLYYLGRADYVIDENLLQISKLRKHRNPQGLWMDTYTNALHITNTENLKKLNDAGDKTLWVFLGHSGRGFEEIVEYIRETYENVGMNKKYKKINIYRKISA